MLQELRLLEGVVRHPFRNRIRPSRNLVFRCPNVIRGPPCSWNLGRMGLG